MSMSGSHNQGDLGTIIDAMLDDASELRRMVEEDIPEAFPFVEAIEGLDRNYTHVGSDFPGYGVFTSFLEDALSGYDIMKKIREIILATKLIIKNFIPNELRNGMVTIEVGKDFEELVITLDENLKRIEMVGQRIMEGQDTTPVETMDLSELRKLRNHFVVLGWQLAKSPNWEVPNELRGTAYNVASKQALRQMEQAVTPNLIQLSSPAKNISTRGMTVPKDLSLRANSFSSQLRR